MKITSSILLLFAIGSLIALPALAQDSATDEALDKELLERQIAHNAAPIKSEPELHRYIASGKGNTRPLSYLSESARKRFIKSLVFTERGLASFDYWDLRAELTAAQAYEVLSLFGAQRSTRSIPNLHIVNERDAAISEWSTGGSPNPVIDYPDFKCESRATCGYNTNTICIRSNC